MLTPKQVLTLVKDNGSYLAHNYELIDIFEGNLGPYVEKCLKDQLSLQSFLQAVARMVPINILPKIIDKLTNIYQTTVVRDVEEGTESDVELVQWYEGSMDINCVMNSANEMVNLTKAALLYPYLHKGKPRLRVIKSDSFIVHSADHVDPMCPTDAIVSGGKDENGKELYWVFGESSFFICDSDEKMRFDKMVELTGSAEIYNPILRFPFVYLNESHYSLRPKQDTDILRLVKVIPVMLTDLNLAAMFQSFSIIYGIDLDAEGLQRSPNAMWHLKSDATSDKKPEIGTIKPDVDYSEVLNLISTELSLWLGTKGIRASTVGGLDKENFASGISKVIDEMDTFEARQKQTAYYTKKERELWDLILLGYHPYWSMTNQIENKATFTSTAYVNTSFAVQLPMQSRGVAVTDLKNEVAAGFTTRKRAIIKLNPEMTEEQVEELMTEIDEERNGVAEDQVGDPGRPEAEPEGGASGSGY